MTKTHVRLKGAPPRVSISSALHKGFLAFCAARGMPSRPHSSLHVDGYQVQFQGHWMGVSWLKVCGDYTVDRRLSGVLSEFHKSIS